MYSFREDQLSDDAGDYLSFDPGCSCSMDEDDRRPLQPTTAKIQWAPVKNTGYITWKHSTDPPTSIGHLAFLLDCFVISFGPDMPQLGRYHPRSDPEEYAVEVISEDEWSLRDEDEYDEPTTTVPWTSECQDIKFDKIGPCYKKKFKTTHTHSQLTGTHDRRCCGENHYELLEARNSSRRRVSNWNDPNMREDLDSLDGNEFPNDDVIRELSEMRLILERLLENRDLLEFYDNNGLRDILELLPDRNLANLPISEASPHFPVGEWKYEECGICLVVQWLYRRPCCHYSACKDCLQKYYSQKVEDGIVKIECCNVKCNFYVHRDEISARLEGPVKDKFHKLLVLANEDSTTKTCPRCNHVTKFNRKVEKKRRRRRRKTDAKSTNTSVTCGACGLKWCFPCHAPWHEALTCKQFRKGDRLLKTWAKEKNHGQLNAQKCPKCKIYIQRTAGCDHMHCNRCKTDFCYKCGDRFRYLKFFGDHYSKLSIFGCKYRFKADRPMQRKVIRGAIFGGKVVAAPVLGALALCAGALAVGVSVVALPIYCGVRLYRHCEGRQHAKALRREIPELPAPMSTPTGIGGGPCVWEYLVGQED